MEKTNIKVIIKSRPRIQREIDSHQMEQWEISGNTIQCMSPLHPTYRYTFDKIYDQSATNDELYKNDVQPIVNKVINGYHGTIFAYGQTSSGKTHTMLGTKENPGIIRMAAEQIFDEIQKCPAGKTFMIKVKYFEIYNENVIDLQKDSKEMQKGVVDAKWVQVKDDIIKIIDDGNANRKVAQTKMNMQSSRSHAILQIFFESIRSSDDDIALVSSLNLVDLAGSERADQSGATGSRLIEAGNINKSLLTLSRVIEILSGMKSSNDVVHIPYRNSKLTYLLKDSLGGNSMTAIICSITPVAIGETNNTLGFAMRAKKIQNEPIVNKVASDAVEVKRMKMKILSLETELKKSKANNDKFHQMQTNVDIMKMEFNSNYN